ncbi:MAG: XdhC family protein [Labilithrix sp.]
MIELDVVSREAAALRARGLPVLLATVVRVAGSSYRRPGARMLVAEDRWLAGCVSGGCLEADVVRRGEFRIRDGVPVVVRYDSTSDDDIGWGFGVGCNGVIEVMLERLAPDAPDDPLAFVRAVIDDESLGAMVTVFESRDPAVPIGARAFLRGSAVTMTCPLPRVWVEAAMQTTARPQIVTHDGVTALVEPIAPPPRVFIAGSGHDAVPLVSLAQAMGMRVTVADRHASIAQRERLAGADELLIGSPEELARAIDARQTALVVVMTHDYDRDREYLGAALGTRARYIGVLGPERRTARLLAELEKGGRRASDDALSRLHAPAGLDVGAETPKEIALAILAEMQAKLANARAGYLREREGAIHAASDAIVITKQ